MLLDQGHFVFVFEVFAALSARRMPMSGIQDSTAPAATRLACSRRPRPNGGTAEDDLSHHEKLGKAFTFSSL